MILCPSEPPTEGQREEGGPGEVEEEREEEQQEVEKKVEIKEESDVEVDGDRLQPRSDDDDT